MQAQSDLSGLKVAVSETEELSALGAVYLAGIGAGVYEKDRLFREQRRSYYEPKMEEMKRAERLEDWRRAVSMIINIEGK